MEVMITIVTRQKKNSGLPPQIHVDFLMTLAVPPPMAGRAHLQVAALEAHGVQPATTAPLAPHGTGVVTGIQK